MAISAFYGNWLIDHDALKLPGYLFVVCNTLIPASIRLAQLPSQFTALGSFQKVGRSLKLVSQTVEGVKIENEAEVEEKRKKFLVGFVKAEVGAPKERLHHHKSPALYRVRRKALSLWYLYFAGFLFAGMVGVGAAAVTKMNGNMFEFYNKPQIQIYFPRGIRHAWQYVTVGFSILVSGALMGAVFGFNSETSVGQLRWDLFNVAANGFLEKPGLVTLLTKFTGQCKSAFDNRLATFLIGILSVICGILSNIHKGLIYSFLTSVAYGLQTVTQFFFFRFVEIHGNHSRKAVLKRGQKLVAKIESIPASEFDERQHEISKEHNRFLSFEFHKMSSNVVAQAIKFSFTVALPQVTQSFAYSIGTYLIFDDQIRPLQVYKILGTIHASVAAVANAATFPNDIHACRLAAQHIDEVIPLANFSIEDGSRKSSTSSNDSNDSEE
uniref:ABC transmembrane type-1 domain-containing protein n=1 Tax=Panagrolaimus sp. JU765 TaxID=591449 RepID=A0AC34QP93_9BILA